MKESHNAAEQNVIDMDLARRQSTVNSALLTKYLYGGKEAWDRKQKLLKVISKDPIFDKTQRPFLDRTKLYERSWRITNRLLELEQLQKWTAEEFRTAFAMIDDSSSFGLHMVAFEPVFMAQAGPKLREHYGPLIRNRAILGCYLQTELAHGTNVAKLETTASYIPETKEFELHSPTITSSKWWIGALGKSATHGVVQAKLILPGGKDMGPHLFFVQLRSLKNHKLMPGITAGDIGPKGGTATVDNGFARFNHIRIPKDHMLSKFAQVTDDGKYVQPPHAKISYGGMLYIRVGMVATAGWICAKAITVAIRYGTVRRQGEIGADGLERQVISYPSLHYRLLPILSHAYVFIKLSDVVVSAFAAMSERLASGDASLLPEMHAITSGLKVLATTTVIGDLEAARRSMGGHGYSAFSGVWRMYADYVPSATFEGENFVLDQQVVRSAVKSYNNHVAPSSGKSLAPSSYYLRLLQDPSLRPPAISKDTWSDSKTLILLLEWRAALLVREAVQTASDPDANIGQRVSKAVTEAFVAARVGDMIENLGTDEHLDEEEKRVAAKLYHLYLLTTLEGGLTDLLSFQLLPIGTGAEDPARGLRVAVALLCQELLPNGIGLTDAFGFSDWELDSALGRYDGRAYDGLLAAVKTEPLNGTEVTRAYKESIKPILIRGKKLAKL